MTAKGGKVRRRPLRPAPNSETRSNDFSGDRTSSADCASARRCRSPRDGKEHHRPRRLRPAPPGPPHYTSCGHILCAASSKVPGRGQASRWPTGRRQQGDAALPRETAAYLEFRQPDTGRRGQSRFRRSGAGLSRDGPFGCETAAILARRADCVRGKNLCWSLPPSEQKPRG